jgi:transposase
MNATTYAIDTAKSVFQLHWVQPDTGEIHRKKLQRAKLMEFFARLQPCRIVMEACGGAHHWGRELSKLGHQVELLPPHKVKESASGNKDDARDARAIWITATHKDVRRVPVKTVEQQAQLFTHRVRSHWVSLRTATVNQLRSMLYEFGIVAPKGRKKVLGWVAEHRAQIEQQVPSMVVQLMDQQLQALRELDERIVANERTVQQAQRTDETVRELLKVPGIGPLGASALRAELGDGSAWKNSREFACCRGLVPRHTGTGGKVRMAGISKRGDPYLRTLLIHGARNLVRVPNPPQWIADMLVRRPSNVVAVAVAHKLARIAWSIVARGEKFDAVRAFGAKPVPA